MRFFDLLNGSSARQHRLSIGDYRHRIESASHVPLDGGGTATMMGRGGLMGGSMAAWFQVHHLVGPLFNEADSRL